MIAIAYVIYPTLFHRKVPSPGDLPDVGMYNADPHSDKVAHTASASVRSHDKTRSTQDVTRQTRILSYWRTQRRGERRVRCS